MRTEDGNIIYRCLNEDPTAFGLLVDKYKASIFSIAYSMLRNFHDAEDITQDVFIKAYKNLSTLRRWDNFLAWLCSIAYNMSRNRIKEQSRHKESERLGKKARKELNDHSVNSYREKQVFESLHEALDSLPDIYREVLTLYYLGGISGEQIARILSIPYATVRQRLSRARAQLREEILAMVSETFEQQRLKASFTFRIVEMVKRIKVNPVSTMKGLPWGLSLATGIILAFLGFGSHLNVPINFDMSINSTLSGESTVLRDGEFSVDVLKVSNTPIISNGNLNGNGLGSIVPSLQSALFMAPQAGDTWTKKADMPTATASSSACVINGKIYVIGGAPNNVDPIATVQEYDPIANKWDKKADMPTARGYLTTSVVNGRIYAIGGSIRDKNAQWFDLLTVEEYNPATDEWTKKTDMPTARGCLSSSAVNGRIYTIGGYENKNEAPLSTVEEYNPATDKWIKKTDMPTGRSYLSVCAVNGKIYAIGGFSLVEDLSTVEEYDPVSDKWSIKTNMPTSRADLTASVVNGKIYAIGGIPLLTAGSVVEEYDPSTDKWKKMSNMLTARHSLSSCATNNRVYAIGGQIQGDLGMIAIPTVEEYDPGTVGQSINLKGKLPTTWGEVRTAMNR